MIHLLQLKLHPELPEICFALQVIIIEYAITIIYREPKAGIWIPAKGTCKTAKIAAVYGL